MYKCEVEMTQQSSSFMKEEQYVMQKICILYISWFISNTNEKQK